MDLEFGQYRLKRQERLLIGPIGPVELSSRSFDILTVLLDKPNEVIGKPVLLGAVWPGLTVEENTLQVHISALRKALGPDIVVTVPGRGYKYCRSSTNACWQCANRRSSADARRQAGHRRAAFREPQRRCGPAVFQ